MASLSAKPGGGVSVFCPMPMNEEAGFGSGPVFPASGGAGVFAQLGLEHIAQQSWVIQQPHYSQKCGCFGGII